MSLASRFLVPWKAYVTLVTPIALLPLALSSYRVLRCLYVVLLMTIVWATEALPFAITALIPVSFYPVLGIMGTADVCYEYLKDTSLMFLGSMLGAVAIEHSGLHNRVALWFVVQIGTTPMRVMSAIMLSTVVLSMWVANSAAATLVYPIVGGIVAQIKAGREGTSVAAPAKPAEDGSPPERPDNETVGYYIAVAYGATIGGIGTLLGTPPNFLLKIEYERAFKDYKTISYGKWMIFSTPYCFLATGLVLLWLQILYNGLFRAKTPEQTKNIEAQEAVRNVLQEKRESMGPMTFHELVVLVMFAVVTVFCLFRQPSLFDGWSSAFYLKQGIFDATAIYFMVILFFLVPVNLNFYRFSEPYEKMTPTIITWKVAQNRTCWDVMLLFGGSFAMAEGMRVSGLLLSISEQVYTLKDLAPLAMMLISVLVTIALTTLGCNSAVASVVLPVLANVAKEMKVHPLYLMMPAAIASSLAFVLPASTPPNALAVSQGGVTTLDLLKAGSVATLLCFVLLVGLFLGVGVFAYGLNEYPDYG